MDVRNTQNYEDGLPLRKPAKKRARKNHLPMFPRPALPPEAERPFRQLMDALMHDDLDIRCRAMLWVKEFGEPLLMHRILYEVQTALRSRSQEVRDKASTLIYFLGPRLVGFPPPPPTLNDLTKRLDKPTPRYAGERQRLSAATWAKQPNRPWNCSCKCSTTRMMRCSSEPPWPSARLPARFPKNHRHRPTLNCCGLCFLSKKLLGGLPSRSFLGVRIARTRVVIRQRESRPAATALRWLTLGK